MPATSSRMPTRRASPGQGTGAIHRTAVASTSGGRSKWVQAWSWKYLYSGKEKRLALGSYTEPGSKKVRVTFQQAREARDYARKVQLSGVDPAQRRQLANKPPKASLQGRRSLQSPENCTR